MIDIWVVQTQGGNPQQITDTPFPALFQTWSPDSRRLAFAAIQEGQADIFVVELESGAERRITDTPDSEFALSWSPRGSEIVFQAQGRGGADIWVVDVSSRAIRQLTRDSANDRLPAWSPDGSRVVFESDRGGVRQLWVVDAAGGDPRRITTDPGSELFPKWSPDGSLISYLTDRRGNLDVWVTDPAGRLPRPVVATDYDDSGGDWLVDSSGLLVSSVGDGFADLFSATLSGDLVQLTFDRAFESARLMPNGRDLVMSRYDDSQRPIVADLGGERWDAPLPNNQAVRQMAASPDGATLVYVAAGGLWLTDITDPEPRPVFPNLSQASSPVWSPDGRRIVVSVGTGAGSELWALSPGTGDAQPLTENEFAERSVVWVDSSTIAYVGGLRGGDVWQLSLEGSVAKNVGPGVGAQELVWCGGTLLFSRADDHGVYQVFSLDTTNATTRQITTGPKHEFGSCSSSGDWIAVQRTGTDGGLDVWRMRPDGQEAQPVSERPETEFSPVWSPSDTDIVFSVMQDGHQRLMSVAASGGEPIAVAGPEGNQTSPVFVTDRSLLYLSWNIDGDLYLLDLPE
ncbi:MAG: DPP IV N-terminal domain-containing protein [Gemmatimonadetes bacterium]|nr:DPP IV N-terminal domain-containing protein [Gemmatimonadota bacterium]